VGTGRFDANLQTVTTNFVAALAQCEAAMEIFREADAGHLVVISSVAAERGLKGAQTVYAATKAALSNLAEGIRSDVADTPIRVSTMAPGYILTEIGSGARSRPFAVDEATGSKALADAIEREPAHAYVPGWPWGLIGPLMQTLPLPILRRLS
jgi:NAD(P)-dependent dehydrogenase (short-subunit alcohol dehydrogenase family)